jgi:hypothetical protein
MGKMLHRFLLIAFASFCLRCKDAGTDKLPENTEKVQDVFTAIDVFVDHSREESLFIFDEKSKPEITSEMHSAGKGGIIYSWISSYHTVINDLIIHEFVRKKDEEIAIALALDGFGYFSADIIGEGQVKYSLKLPFDVVLVGQ